MRHLPLSQPAILPAERRTPEFLDIGLPPRILGISLQLHSSWGFPLLTKQSLPHIPQYSRTCPYNVVLNALIWQYFLL